MLRASDLFCDTLIEAGIDHVFGMPGGGALAIWDSLADHKDKINTFLARHEGGAACMADAYARLTGKPGLLIGQGLWIGTSGGYGIVESYLAGVPMVILADVSDYAGLSQFGPYQNATGDYGAVDLPAMMKSMTKFTTVASNPSELVHGIQLAVKHAVTGRPGPACVLMRMGAAGTIEEKKIRPMLHPLAGYLNTSPPSISKADADRIAALLIGAKNPVMIAGSGVHRSKAYEELQTLAEILGMPVATSYMGKSTIPETHALCLGTMGLIGQKVANDVIMAADVILAVGTCLAPDNTKFLSPKFIDPTKQKIIQIDIESLNAGWSYPIELGVTSDAKLALQAIIGSIKYQDPQIDAEARVAAITKAKADADFFYDEALTSDQSPIVPERVVNELNQVISEDDIVVLDAGNNRMWMAHYFKSQKAGQVIAGGGAAAVGYGLGATLGAQFASPGKNVIGVCGDGGMMMHCYVFEMAREFKLPVTYVVMNNACLGNVMDAQAGEIARSTTSYERADFAKIARGFGIEGVTVEKAEDLRPALEKAIATDGPVVVDVVIDDYPHLKLRKG